MWKENVTIRWVSNRLKLKERINNYINVQINCFQIFLFLGAKTFTSLLEDIY